MEEETDNVIMSCLTAIHAKADTTLDKLRTEIVIKEQRQDSHLSHILGGLQNKQYSLQYMLRDGLLYKIDTNERRSIILRLCIPKSLREPVMNLYHEKTHTQE